MINNSRADLDECFHKFKIVWWHVLPIIWVVVLTVDNSMLFVSVKLLAPADELKLCSEKQAEGHSCILYKKFSNNDKMNIL